MAAAKPKTRVVEFKAFPHNGEGRPALQFPDPVNGEMIGGQVAFNRMTMRFQSVVCPWARRQGKTKSRQWLIPNEATLTSGPYWAGMCLPDHSTAFKIWQDFVTGWGDMVKDKKGDDKSQDRWIDLHQMAPIPLDRIPTWFTPGMTRKVQATHKAPNTACRLYFWSVKHPHYEGVQGFPHPFHRIDWDECAQIHRRALTIIRPMLRDVRGKESFTGTPYSKGIGNDWFSDFWDLAGQQETVTTWFRMRVPDGTTPHVPRTDLTEARRTMTETEIRETLYAEFLTDEGAVFSNLAAVLVLKPLDSVPWAHELLREVPLPSIRWWVHRAEPIPGHIHAVSIDWARSPKGDYSVLSVWDLTTGEQIAVFRWRGEDFNEQMEWVLRVQKHYGALQCHSDANGMGRTMSDFMARRKAVGFVAHKFGSNKPDYVRRAQVLFRESGVRLIKFDEQWAEFKSYSAFESDTPGSDHIVYSHPEGKHDDFVDSFLHLAPTITIVGRQEPEREPEAPTNDVVNGRTTLELWGKAFGLPSPYAPRSDDSLILPWVR